MALKSRRCAGKCRSSYRKGTPCGNEGVVEDGGKYYCGSHLPVVTARAEERALACRKAAAERAKVRRAKRLARFADAVDRNLKCDWGFCKLPAKDHVKRRCPAARYQGESGEFTGNYDFGRKDSDEHT